MKGRTVYIVDLSLDELPGKSSLTSLSTVIDYSLPAPTGKKVDDDLLRSIVEEAVNELPEKQRQVVRMRFRMGNYEHEHPMTLEEVGKALNMTRERTRCFEVKALKTLRRILRRKIQDPFNRNLGKLEIHKFEPW